MHPEFLIDANCLVTPNNDYYRPDFRLSQQFWEHLQQLVMNGGIGVISQVAHEVAVGSGSGDCLDEWLLSIQSKIIEPGSDSSIVAKFGEVMNYVATPNLFSQRPSNHGCVTEWRIHGWWPQLRFTAQKSSPLRSMLLRRPISLRVAQRFPMSPGISVLNASPCLISWPRKETSSLRLFQ